MVRVGLLPYDIMAESSKVSPKNSVIDKAASNRKKDNGELSRGNMLRGVLGTYAHPPRQADGRVDIGRLLELLEILQVNTYEFLIRSEADFEDFKLFLPRAAKKSLQVWSCFTNLPKDGPGTPPYGADYLAWARAMAELARQHPNYVAFSVDDFSHAMGEKNRFNRAYLAELYRILHLDGANLAFVPCMYFPKIDKKNLALYGEFLDGILFYYRHEEKLRDPAEMGFSEEQRAKATYWTLTGANLHETNTAREQIATVKYLAGTNCPVILGIYAQGHSILGKTEPEHVRKLMEIGHELADGLMIYTLQYPTNEGNDGHYFYKQKEKHEIVKELFGKWSSK